MPQRRILPLLLVAGILACTNEPSDTLIGKWGAPGIELRATEEQARVALECGWVATDDPITLDASGHFVVEAVRHFSGPPGEYPVYLEGRAHGETIELRWWSVDGEPPEHFMQVSPGVRANLRDVACPL